MRGSFAAYPKYQESPTPGLQPNILDDAKAGQRFTQLRGLFGQACLLLPARNWHKVKVIFQVRNLERFACLLATCTHG